jgi:hypothetical protein
MEISERQTDMAGKYRVLVSISNERAIPLKFETEVSDDVVFSEAQKVLDLESQQRAEQDYLQSLMDEEKKLLEELGYGSN